MIHQQISLGLDYAALGLQNGGCQPTLTTYLLDNSPDIDPERVRPAVLICPGGGYAFTSDREAEAVAIRFNSYGYHALVLRYSVAPAEFPASLVELAAAVRLVRERAEVWHVDRKRVLVAGFSAGAHLACSLGVFWNQPFLQKLLGTEPESYRPDGMILSYPVITSGEFAHRGSFVNLLGGQDDAKRALVSLEHQVSKETPPAFIWHTFADNSVPLENSLLLADALRKAGVPFELHIYPHGGHGLGLANEETMCKRTGFGVQPECQSWTELAHTWVQHNF